MIEKIAITNFKSHARTEIELGRVMALVGPNGCGKTSLLLATYCLSLLAHQSIDQTFSKELSAFQMTALKGFAEKHGKQIVLTSHSPYIIDELRNEDVWVMATDVKGISHCKRLSNHPDIKAALGVLTTGETWSAEGEDWVLEETVQPEEVNA